VVAGLLVLAPTLYMLEVYERVLTSRNLTTLLMLTLLVLGALAVMEVLHWARSETLREASNRLDHRMAPSVWLAMHHMALRQWGQANLQLMTDFATVRQFLVHPVVGAFMEAPVALLFGVLLFAISPWLGAVALVVALVQVLLAAWNERSTHPPLAQANQHATGAQQMAERAWQQAEVIQAMGMLPAVHRLWQQRQQQGVQAQAQASDAAGAFQAVGKALQTILGSALLGLGAWLLLSAQLPGGAGAMILASVLGARLLAPLVQVVQQWRSVVAVRDAWSRLSEVLARLPTPPERLSLPAPVGHLAVERVTAVPPARPGAMEPPPPILRGIHWALRPGEMLAVVGPSASGKTTLSRMLVGLWPAVNGKVRLDGADLFAWNKDELGPYVGYLPQGVDLLEGTMADNIARVGPVDMNQVLDAARLAGVDGFIRGLPLGLDTPVGPDGAVLSGGQRQRIALARALYGNPVLVVMDEPNASLDDAGDAALAQAIQALKARLATVVVVTHRQQVLQLADKLLVLNQGMQQAFGPRDEVLAAMAQAQAGAGGEQLPARARPLAAMTGGRP
jgi:ATP-binding cassette subfamily C exporter for protease/lipase